MFRELDKQTEHEMEEQFLGTVLGWFAGPTAGPTGTVNRQSKAYISWVQQSLNKIMGLKLAVDGRVGAQTRSAVRAFQTKAGLTVDGKVGANTEKALIRAGATQPPTSSTPAPSTAKGPLALVGTRLPRSGPGFTTTNNNRKYGIPETVQALQAIAAEWSRRHPEVVMGVGDMSQEGGGKIDPHVSHRAGLDADVHLLINNQRITSTDPRFREWRRYVEEFAQLVKRNSVLPVKKVWFQDPQRQTKNVDHITDGHTKHLHIRFCMPAAYRSQLDLGRIYGPGEKKADYNC